MGLGALARTPAGGARTPRVGLGQLTNPGRHGVGPFRGLDRQHQAIADDSALPDVEPANGPGGNERALDVFAVPLSRGYGAQTAKRQGHGPGGLMSTLDLEAFLAEFVEHCPQQPVVTLAGGGDDRGQRGHAAHIGLEFGEIGPGDRPGEADQLAMFLAQSLENLAEFGEADVRRRVVTRAIVGKAAQTNYEIGPAGPPATVGDFSGQSPTARDDSEFPHDQTSRSGRQSGRVASSRMKATISMISGTSG